MEGTATKLYSCVLDYATTYDDCRVQGHCPRAALAQFFSLFYQWNDTQAEKKITICRIISQFVNARIKP